MPFEPPKSVDPLEKLRLLMSLQQMMEQRNLYARQRSDELSTQALGLASKGVLPGTIADFGAQSGVDTSVAQRIADQVRLDTERARVMDPRGIDAAATAGAPVMSAQGTLGRTPEQQAQFGQVIGALQGSADPRLRADALNAIGTQIAGKQAEAQSAAGAQRYAQKLQVEAQDRSFGQQRSLQQQSQKFAVSQDAAALTRKQMEEQTSSFADTMVAGNAGYKNEVYGNLVQQYGYDTANEITRRASVLAAGRIGEDERKLGLASVSVGGLSKETLAQSYEARLGFRPADWMLDMERLPQARGFVSEISTPDNVVFVPSGDSQARTRDQTLSRLSRDVSHLGDLMDALASSGAAGLENQEWMTPWKAAVGKLPGPVAAYVTARTLIVNGVIKLAQEGKISDQDFTRFLEAMPLLAEISPEGMQPGGGARAKLDEIRHFLVNQAGVPATYSVSAEQRANYLRVGDSFADKSTLRGQESYLRDRRLEGATGNLRSAARSNINPESRARVDAFMKGALQ